MSRSKKPRKAYRGEKKVYLNTMRVAQALKSTLTRDERAQIIDEANLSLENLRTGRLTAHDWGTLGECANVGMALSSIGICSDEQSRGLLESMLVALKAVALRANERGVRVATGQELASITAGLERHIIQLDYCSAEELRDAVVMVQRLKSTARAGKCEVVTMETA